MALLATPVAGPGVLTAGPPFGRNLLRAGSGPGVRWCEEELDVYADVLRDPAREQASSACDRTFRDGGHRRPLPPGGGAGGGRPADRGVAALGRAAAVGVRHQRADLERDRSTNRETCIRVAAGW
jgi:hypothetical protein